MEKIVSVIVPVYNISEYLPTCLDSLINQTYKNIRIILVDDGSTDDSGKICDEYAARDTRITVIHQTNAGAANAKNAGLDAAKGDYIVFVDSDDWVESCWIEKMLHSSLSHNADVVECSFAMEYVNRSSHGNSADTFLKTRFETEDYLRGYPYLWTNALFWNKIFKSDLLRDVRFHTERRCIDDEFFTYKAVTGANCVYRIPDELYHYRQRRSSVTQKKSTLYQRTIDDIDILAERHQWMKKHYPNIAEDYLRHDVDTLLYFANSYFFNDEAVSRLRKTTRYYCKEAFRAHPDKRTVFYALKLLFYKKKRLHTEISVTDEKANEEQYFL